jgi:hypothetical protein
MSSSDSSLVYRALAGNGQLIENFGPRIIRSGYLEQTYFTTSLSPIFNESGEVAGLINLGQETTKKVLMTRRLKTYRELAIGTQGMHIAY